MRGSRALARAVAFAAAALAAGPAAAQFALDHFTVYDATGTIDPPAVVLQDQFGIQSTDLGPTRLFLVPADKNGEGIVDPGSHLTCYDLPSGMAGPPQVSATHQFGTQTLNLGQALYACIPTQKFQTTQISIDHYVCYDATGTSPLQVPTFVDQFYGATHQILSAFLFCAPALKTTAEIPPEPILDPLSHLACYDIDPLGAAVGAVPILNQFGLDTINILQRRAVCLPALKEVPPPGVLDHFLYYDASGPDAPLVAVDDQFGAQPEIDLGPATSFLVPADKNGEGIVDPISHLTGYFIPPGLPEPDVQTVIATNQFGQQAIQIGEPRELLVPTVKLITLGNVSIDHFLCYNATGDPLGVPVTVLDQFHDEVANTTVQQPFLFCNPANKNGEGLVNADDHLVCFFIGPTLTVGPVQVANQFGQAALDVFMDTGLCVPSEKTIPVKVPSVSAWGLGVLGAALFGVPALLVARRRLARA